VVVVTASVLIGAALQSATGLGFAMVASPALLAAVSPGQAVTTLLVLGTLLGLLVLLTEGRARRIRWAALWPVIAASVPGLVVGALVLHAVPKHPLQIAAGVVVLAAVVMRLRGASTVTRPADGAGWDGLGTGAVTGVLSTATGMSGPLLALWLQHRIESPEELRDSLAASFLLLSVLGAAALAVIAPGRFTLSPARVAILAVCVVVGRAVGRRVFERLAPRAFRTAGLAVIAAAGTASIFAGLS
jgi:uncharacterized protein